MGTNRSPVSDLELIAETNRLGALVFLHEICAPPSPATVLVTTTESDEGPSKVVGLPVLPADEKAKYVRRILDLIEHNRADMMRTAALPLWPLFLAGCCVRREDDRVPVLRIFEESEGMKRFGVSFVHVIQTMQDP